MVIIGAAPMITVVERFADYLPRGDGSDPASRTWKSFRLSRGQRPHQLLRQVRRFTPRPPDQQPHHQGISLHGPERTPFNWTCPVKRTTDG